MSGLLNYGGSAGKWRCVSFAAVLGLILFPCPARALDQTLLLEVELNGHSIGKIGEFLMRDGTLLIRRDELADLGLRGPRVLVRRGSVAIPHSEDLIALADLPGLSLRIDQKTQTAYLTASNERLLPKRLQVDAEERPLPDPRSIESGKGATVNYDVIGTQMGQQSGASGLFDLRIFSPWGIASTGLLGYAGATPEVLGATPQAFGATPGSSGSNRVVRLDTSYTFADVGTLRRYSAGDFITSSLSWTRPVRMGGIQVRSDFSLRPDLVTFPLPSISGSAAVPSTVDVLTNGNLVLSRQVDAGTFEIPQVPVVSGQSTISMTVTNAMGQQVNITQPFYASAALLAPGLQTFSLQVGAVRRYWGSLSNDYGKLAASGNYCRGLNPIVTIESSMEATPGAVAAGGGGSVRVGSLGVLSLSAAASTGQGRIGSQASVRAQRIGTVFSLGASAIVASRHFGDIASVNGDPVANLQLSANGEMSLRRFGSAGAAYADTDRSASSLLINNFPMPQQHERLLLASYSVPLHRISVYANIFRDFANANVGEQIGVTIPLSRRSTANVSAGSGNGYGQVQVQQSAAQIGQMGYEVYLDADSPGHEFAQLQYKSPWALLTAGVDQSGAQTTLRIESQGAISVADRGIFPSNTIYDSFAIVDTNGLSHVRVLQENREVGVTDSAGRLLVPDMRAFNLNHLAIDPTDIPLDATIEQVSRDVRPQDRSGIVVRFAVKTRHGALLRLIDEAGLAVPVGSTARLQATGDISPVGFDGEAYILDLSAWNQVEIERPDGRRCSANFNFLPISNVIPTVGPLLCRERAQ